LVTGAESNIAFDTASINDWRAASVTDLRPTASSSSGLSCIAPATA
jgi:hypothetical protein